MVIILFRPSLGLGVTALCLFLRLGSRRLSAFVVKENPFYPICLFIYHFYLGVQTETRR